jgi:nitrogen-specific signal transduction histidine kinase
LEKVSVQRLKKTLDYLLSKQRELEKNHETDTRSLESMIKYLKKDMVEQFKLVTYDGSIQQEIKDTETFISRVQNIIENNS